VDGNAFGLACNGKEQSDLQLLLLYGTTTYNFCFVDFFLPHAEPVILFHQHVGFLLFKIPLDYSCLYVLRDTVLYSLTGLGFGG